MKRFRLAVTSMRKNYVVNAYFFGKSQFYRIYSPARRPPIDTFQFRHDPARSFPPQVEPIRGEGGVTVTPRRDFLGAEGPQFGCPASAAG